MIVFVIPFSHPSSSFVLVFVAAIATFLRHYTPEWQTLFQQLDKVLWNCFGSHAKEDQFNLLLNYSRGCKAVALEEGKLLIIIVNVFVRIASRRDLGYPDTERT